MKRSDLAGRIQTVLGLIDPESLGVTLPHEHLLTDLSAYFVEPTSPVERKLAHEPIKMDNLCWVMNHLFSHEDDLKLDDEGMIIKEAMMFKMAGGNTIVEMSNIGLSRDPLGLARIARATGLNIVMGAGYYVGASHPPELASMSEEEIAQGIVRDIMVGVGDTGVRAGIIGEIGCSVPFDEEERKVMRACAIAQRRTGVAINVHPSFDDDLGLENIKVLADAGANLSRVVVSHVDAWRYSRATNHKLADAGCYIEYDCFGHSYPGIHPPYGGRIIDYGSDLQRIGDIMQLIADGYLSHILIASDHCFKHVLTTYGGCGYGYIPRDIVPLMRSKDMSDEQIHTLLVENPKRLLTFAPPKK